MTLVRIALFAAVAGLTVLSTPARPSLRVAAVPDSIVVRVYTEEGHGHVSGVVLANDTSFSRRVSDVSTPVEFRLSATSAHAMFRLLDGGELSAEMYVLRNGEKEAGTSSTGQGTLMLFIDRDGEVGTAGLR